MNPNAFTLHFPIYLKDVNFQGENMEGSNEFQNVPVLSPEFVERLQTINVPVLSPAFEEWLETILGKFLLFFFYSFCCVFL